MVKKVKKLSEEEIEEYKHENYQMMAAIAGKPVLELLGEPSSRPNYKENYCLIKQMYLKNCAGPISSKDLFKTLQNQGYKAKYSTFRGLLNNYMKYGYICKINAKKPFLYVLTDEGKLHAKNPYIAVDENIKRYRSMLYDKFKDLINENPEQFKTIYESISGVQNSIINTVVPAGTSYNDNLGSEELKQELNNKIFDSEFFKNADNDKLKLFADGLLDDSLSKEEKQQLLIDALDEARKTYKGSITINKQYQSTKPEGFRNYYSILISCIDKPVTRSVYENLPFKFIYVESKKELRLTSTPVAGVYRNHEDGKILDFDYLNRTYFNNRMMIKTKPNSDKRELEFYYVGGYNKYQITTMSFSDYQEAVNKSRKQSVKINVQKD